jgi:hypothetical protein
MAEVIKTTKKVTTPAYERAKGNELVRGIFHFWEVPGGVLEFNYKGKYKGDPMEAWVFNDGEERRIPLRIAQHLNSSGKVPESEHVQGPDNKTHVKIGRVYSRYGFESLEFLRIEEIGDSDPVSAVYTVETVVK